MLCERGSPPRCCSRGPPANGVVHSQFAIPNAAVLINQVVNHQVVALELDLGASIVAATSSNGLALTIGSF